MRKTRKKIKSAQEVDLGIARIFIVVFLLFLQPRIVVSANLEECTRAIKEHTGLNTKLFLRPLQFLREIGIHAESAKIREIIRMALPILSNPRHPNFSNALLETAEALNRTGLRRYDRRIDKTIKKLKHQLIELVKLYPNKEFCTKKGLYARLRLALYGGMDFDPPNFLDIRLHEREKRAFKTQLPFESQELLHPAMSTYSAITSKIFSSDKAIRAADVLQCSLDSIGLQLRKICQTKTFGADEESACEKIVYNLRGGELLTNTGIEVGTRFGPHFIENTPGWTLTHEVFPLVRSRLAGDVQIAIYEPKNCTRGGKPLTPKEQKELWQYNILNGLEEYFHVVQALRSFGGLSDTNVNVSTWARSQHQPFEIDHEADVYAHLVELVGPLDPIYILAYDSRKLVPNLSLAFR